MKRDEWFQALDRALADFSAEERGKTRLFYEEMYSDLTEEGCTEEEATARLGDPEEIVRDLRAESPAGAAFAGQSAGRKALIIVLLVLGFPIWGSLALTAACLLLIAYILIWVPALVLAVVALGCLAGAVGMAVASPFLMAHNLAFGLVQLGGALLGLGVGLFSFVGFLYICKGTARLTVSLTRKAKKLLRKNRRDGK